MSPEKPGKRWNKRIPSLLTAVIGAQTLMGEWGSASEISHTMPWKYHESISALCKLWWKGQKPKIFPSSPFTENIPLQPSYSPCHKCRTCTSDKILFQVRNVQFYLFTAMLHNPSLPYWHQDAQPAEESHFRVVLYHRKHAVSKLHAHEPPLPARHHSMTKSPFP